MLVFGGLLVIVTPSGVTPIGASLTTVHWLWLGNAQNCCRSPAPRRRSGWDRISSPPAARLRRKSGRWRRRRPRRTWPACSPCRPQWNHRATQKRVAALTHEGADQSCPQQCGCPNKIEVKPRIAQNADTNFLEDNDSSDCRHQQVTNRMNRCREQRGRWGDR
jgi:hypothetical protein